MDITGTQGETALDLGGYKFSDNLSSMGELYLQIIRREHLKTLKIVILKIT